MLKGKIKYEKANWLSYVFKNNFLTLI